MNGRLWWMGLVALAASAPAWAGSTYYPGLGTWGALLYEDLWPATGDRDFNDLVVLHNVTFFDDDAAGGTVDRMLYALSVQGMGASRCGGLALRLPASSTHLVSVSMRLGTAGASDGAPWGTATAPTVTVEGGEPILWLVDDVRAELCDGAAGFVNTDALIPATPCRPVELSLQFDGSNDLDTLDAPFDLFWTACGDPSVQIHRPGYAPTAAAAGSPLLGSQDSDPANPYVHRPGAPLAGLPWVLTLGEDPNGYPRESVRIETAWPSILDFAAGTGGTDFYEDEEVQTGAVFTAGAGIPRPAPTRACYGNDSTCAASSCLAVLQAGHAHGDGQYWANVGGGPFPVYCDMTTDGGGWTLIHKTNKSSASDRTEAGYNAPALQLAAVDTVAVYSRATMTTLGSTYRIRSTDGKTLFWEGLPYYMTDAHPAAPSTFHAKTTWAGAWNPGWYAYNPSHSLCAGWGPDPGTEHMCIQRWCCGSPNNGQWYNGGSWPAGYYSGTGWVR